MPESELFGHVRGAYTGAYESRGGLFEAADKGTLFLDEIGEASLGFQSRLLRVIEEQAVRRIGDQELRKVDVRIIAATNRDLEMAIAQKEFRQDLFYRLCGFQIEVPPLRNHAEDIPYLVFHTLDIWERRNERACPGITREAVKLLMEYDWPGNVRELIHVVEGVAATAGREPIRAAHLPPHFRSRKQTFLAEIPEEEERQAITEVLHATRGNITRAAQRLGMSRSTLYRRMKKLGIHPSR